MDRKRASKITEMMIDVSAADIKDTLKSLEELESKVIDARKQLELDEKKQEMSRLIDVKISISRVINNSEDEIQTCENLI